MSTAGLAESHTIVCVDDDALLLNTLREQLLRGLGRDVEVEIASNAIEALELLQLLADEGIEVPLMVSDHIMPGMHGAELLTRVNEQHPDMLKILLTGQADMSAVTRAINEANLYRLITKPWQENDLVLTVREALRRVEQDRLLQAQTAALERSHAELEQSMELLHATMDATLDGILVLDMEGHLVQLNRQLIELWSIPASMQVTAKRDALLIHCRERLEAPALLALDTVDGLVKPIDLILKNGRVLETVSRPHRLHDQPIGMVYSFRDVTERWTHQETIRHQAFHDTLCDLPNRARFDQVLGDTLARAKVEGYRFAVMFIDLDHFKRINDSEGHEVGDKLLQQVARRISHSLRQQDMAARWGGDEFIVLLPHINLSSELDVIAQRVLDALDSPIDIDGLAIHISVSIGAAMFPDDALDAQKLVKHADHALYVVKGEGRNGYRHFQKTGEDESNSTSELQLESELRQALEHAELRLYYQPQIDTTTGLIDGVEALIRWKHPRRGLLFPGDFLHVAERSGLILPIGAWVIDTASAQAAEWARQGFGALSVAVNLSCKQFERGNVPGLIAEALMRHSLAPGQLEVEITEAVAIRNMQATAAILRTLQRSGVRVALDDFGTGFASLNYLKNLPCDTLKLDRTFIGELQEGSIDAAIVRAMIAITTEQGLRLVAEGVETETVRDILRALGCETMQGYLFGKAVPAEECTARLLEQGVPQAPLLKVG